MPRQVNSWKSWSLNVPSRTSGWTLTFPFVLVAIAQLLQAQAPNVCAESGRDRNANNAAATRFLVHKYSDAVL